MENSNNSDLFGRGTICPKRWMGASQNKGKNMDGQTEVAWKMAIKFFDVYCVIILKKKEGEKANICQNIWQNSKVLTLILPRMLHFWCVNKSIWR